MNRRPELLQQLLDSITHSMLEYTTKIENDENITYSISRRFAEIYIKETANINSAYCLYQLTVERLYFPQSLHNLWETQKEVFKGKARQIDVIRKMQEMTETYMREYNALVKILEEAPLYIFPLFPHVPMEDDAAEAADAIVYLRDRLEEFLENTEDPQYEISFKK